MERPIGSRVPGTGHPDPPEGFSADAYERYVEKRREDCRRYYDSVGEKRLRWIRRYPYYYETMLEIVRSFIPEGSRVLEIGCGSGYFLDGVKPSRGLGIDQSEGMVQLARRTYPHLEFRNLPAECAGDLEERFDFVLMVNVAGEITDLERCLRGVHRLCARRTRLVILQHNFLWEPMVKCAAKLGLVMPTPLQNWLTAYDLKTFLHLAGFRILRTGFRCPLPFGLPILSWFFNRLLGRLPIASRLGILQFVVARPLGRVPAPETLRVSVVVPCKNEEANVPSLVDRVPEMGGGTEIILVDDQSADRTRALIEETIRLHPDRSVKPAAGPGEGKGACVRAGLEVATGDVYMILDADMTVMPEVLPRFFDALAGDRGEFVNGSRLVYPAEGEAMRFLNIIGNKLFAWLFTYLLGQRVKDTLCGTKAVWAEDYPRLLKTRAFLRNVDRWGDYDWIFGAALNSLEIVEVPVHYLERKGGESKMTRRLQNAWIMFKVCWFAFWRLKTI